MSKNIVSGAVALLMVVVPSTAFALTQPSPFTIPTIPQNPTISELLDIVNRLTAILTYLTTHPTEPQVCPVYNIPMCAAGEHVVGGDYLPNGCQGAPHCVPDSTNSGIMVTAPNGGEQWEEGILNSVTWTPYSYNPDVNPSRDVTAYLEKVATKENGEQTFVTLGKVEESGKASIHWITGELNSSSQGDNLAPAGGGYYIRVVNNVTGQWDRSDAPFTLKPKPIDLKVNGSDGPITLTRGQQITLSWTSTSQGCMIVGAQRFQTGNEATIENLASNGSMLAYYTGNGGSDIVSLNCQIKVNEGLWIHDNVAVNTVGLTGNIKVLTPNGGEVIPMNQPYGIRVQNAGLSTFAVALYRNDQWFAWINKYVVPSGKDVDLIMWTPSADFPIPSGDGAAYKIYVTGQRAGGSGYIDDKSDAAFSFTPTTSPSGVLTAGTDASSPALQMVSAGSTGVTLGVYKLRATGESINVKKLNVFLSTDGGGSGNPANIQQLYVYSGATLIGTAVFPGLGQNATITLSSPVNVPRDMDVRITIKADIARVGVGQPGIAGSLIKLQLASAEGTGASSGSYIGGNNNESFGKDGVGGVAGVRIQRSYPTVASVPLPSSAGLQDGKLMRFTITANSSGSINVGRLNFRLAMSGATASNVQLYGYSDSSYSMPIPGSVYGGQISNANRMSDELVSVYPFENLVIPAGATYYFELRGTVVTSASNSAITTTLLSDANMMALVPFNALGDTRFAWSPNSLGTVTLTSADWTNGFMVPGLPATGITQTRTSGGSPIPPSGSPRITYTSHGNGVINATYNDMPSNTQVVIMNQTTGARVESLSAMIANGGSAALSVPFPPGMPAGTYYLKAQNYSTQAYIAQTVAFTYSGSTACTAARITQPAEGYSLALSPNQNGVAQMLASDQSVTYTLVNSPSWGTISGSALVFNPVPTAETLYTFNIVATNSCGATVTRSLPVYVRSGSGAFDVASLTTTSGTPTITGTATESAVGISVSNAGGKQYASGIIGNNGGHWSHTITTNLPAGSYTIDLYNFYSNVKLSTGTLTINTQDRVPFACPVYQQPQCPAGQTLISDPSTTEGQCTIPHWHCATPTVPPTTPDKGPVTGSCTFTPTVYSAYFAGISVQGSPSTITVTGGEAACKSWCSSSATPGSSSYTCAYNGTVIQSAAATGPVRSDVVPVSSPVAPTPPTTQSCTTPTYGLTIQNGGTLRAYPYFTGYSYDSASFMTMYTTVMKCSNGTWLTCDLYGNCSDKGGAVSARTSNISNIAFEGDSSSGTVAGVSISLDQQSFNSDQLGQVASVLAAIEGTLRTIIAEFGL